jgi:Methylamine utilisation protein MauE
MGSPCPRGCSAAAAGAAKAFQPEAFAVEVDRFQLTPWLLSLALGYFLPWFEIVTAIALFFRPLYLGALLAISGLGMLFAVAVGSAWWRQLDISCGCFGAVLSGRVNAWHLVSALLFVGVGSALLFYRGRFGKKAIEMSSRRR